MRADRQFAEEWAKIDGVNSIAQQVGRAELSEDTWGPNVTEAWFALDEQKDYDQLLQRLRNAPTRARL